MKATRRCPWFALVAIAITPPHGRSAYFLLVAPGEPTEFGARAIANIHRLTLGETSSIVGAIFLAAGIRPAEQGETRPNLSPIAPLSSHRKTQSAS